MEKERRSAAKSDGKVPGEEKSFRRSERESKESLALVLKADTVGTAEAVVSGLEAIHAEDVSVEAIHVGTGNITGSDLFMAETGSGLILGFNVGLMPGIRESATQKGIEIRLHDVIYKLMEDVKEITGAMIPYEEEERITGRAKVIALFQGGHKGIILGCEVLDGMVSVGKKFRLISDPGTVYTGTIGSLHIETRAVKEATVGQQVGLKIPGFKRAKKGDLVECYETIQPTRKRWKPRGGTFDLRSGTGGQG